MSSPSFRYLVPGALALAAAAPAQDPPVPPGRFGVQTTLNRLITWSDGYKTKLDIYLPSAPAPKTGWPCVLVCHGKGGHRAIVANVVQGREFASFGYAVLAYDIRGEGVTKTLNTSGDTSEGAKLRDMAEVFGLAAALVPGKIDVKRIAVTGRSMGGAHAYRAAAWSGRALPKPGPIVKVFPKVSAVAGDWQALMRPDAIAPGGTLLKVKELQLIYGTRLKKPSRWNLARAHQYASLRSVFAADPFLNYLPAIATNDVPVLGIMGHRDLFHPLWALTKAGTALTLGKVPHRFYFATRGHNIPDNRIEWLLHLDLKRRWWDRYLKGIANGVDREPVAEAGVIPADPNAYTNTATPWRHVLARSWPPPVPVTTYYLTSNGRLTSSPPASASATAFIRNRVATGYGPASFAKDPRVQAVMPKIPLSKVMHGGPALSRPRTLLGRPVLHADVETTSGYVQLAAVLYDIPPTGKPVYVTMGVTGLGQVMAGVYRVLVELDDVAFTFRAGHRIGLSLQNLALRDVPGGSPQVYLLYTPEFNDFDLRARTGGAYPAKIELPLTEAAISLLPRIADVSFGSGLVHNMGLETDRAAAPYFVFFGASGIGSGLDLPPYVPLTIDMWTLLGIQLFGTPSLVGFFGTTAANGRAAPSFRWPGALRRYFAGRRFTFAPLVLAGNRLWSGSPAELRIRP